MVSATARSALGTGWSKIMGTKNSSGDTGRLSRLLRCLPSSYALRTLLVLAVGFVLAYQIENWRGNRAWETYKRAAELKGEVLDWRKLTPPPVPDELNVLKAPRMEEWFRNRAQHRLLEIMSEEAVFGVANDVFPLIKITVLPRSAASLKVSSDMCFDYLPPLVLPAREEEGSPGTTNIPLIVMDDVPLADALRNLARHAGFSYMIDPQLFEHWSRTGHPLVSMRWENVTALQVLAALLHNHNLEWNEDPLTKIARVRYRSDNTSFGQFVPQAAKPLKEAIQELTLRAELDPSVPRVRAAAGAFVLFSDTEQPALHHPDLLRVEIQSDAPLSATDLEVLMRRSGAFSEPYRVRVTAAGTNCFALYLTPPTFCGASDYLARTARFEKEFCLVREALQRPLVRLDGEYASPLKAPVLNFVNLRVMAQTLAQRAQAHLLLDQPAEALEELRLIHALCRLLENHPSGKPVMLVPAMIHVTVAGLYAKTVAEGFQLGKWREPQLRELQELLAEFRLGPVLHGAMALERAGLYRILENTSADEVVEVFSLSGRVPSWWDKLRCPAYWFVSLAPRGWVFQNIVAAAKLTAPLTSAYDPVAQRLDPGPLELRFVQATHQVGRYSPYATLALAVVPSFVRAWQVTAQNQALIDQAYIVCALERYKLHHRTYPRELQNLLPTFATELPRDIMTGEVPRYRLISGDFELYSVGWNQIDDGGYLPGHSEPPGDPRDWVWPKHSIPTSNMTARR